MQVRLFHRHHQQQLADFFANSPHLARMQQVHSDKIQILDSPHSQTAISADALISPFASSLLAVRHADCMPIFIAHPSGIKAAIHAGRRSSELGIFRQVLTILRQKFELQRDFEIYFGPHICERCYQIDPSTDQHYDLREHNLAQLHNLLQPNQFQLSEHGACTLEHPDFYSYRQSGKGVKMNWSVVV